ncbi:hypothetical protein ACE3NQ_12325 [Paenibacillus terreus]|uniref:Small, acid-soluble spore protein, alpha/beta type n=1 Tax=Paenibacillus terreus TaxID=1387834 RepID=A0ABV5BAV5_9BACL
MSNIVSFPNRNVEETDPMAGLKKRIQERFGVTLHEYIGPEGKRSPEIQEKINKAMQKETIRIASNNIKR